MPFTFSHPAIILPAAVIPKKYFSWTGLIIGSMTPDFEYFIRMNDFSEYSHKLSGVLWFDIPLGLLLAFIYHEIVRDSFISNLPKILRIRLSTFCNLNWAAYFKKNWLVVLFSLLIGSLSHILWDGFTHNVGYFVHIFAWLQYPIPFMRSSYHLYLILQYVSSVIGGIAILIAIMRLPKEENNTRSFNPNYWIFVTLISIIGFMFKAFVGFDSNTLHHAIIVVIASGLLAITVTSWLFKPRLDVKRIRE
jgi:hypothetical protein